MDTTTPAGPEPAPGTATPDPAPAQHSNSFFAGVRRLGITRADDRWIGGVCGGLALATGVEAWLWRLMFVLFTLTFGFGVAIYVLLWIFVPEE